MSNPFAEDPLESSENIVSADMSDSLNGSAALAVEQTAATNTSMGGVTNAPNLPTPTSVGLHSKLPPNATDLNSDNSVLNSTFDASGGMNNHLHGVEDLPNDDNAELQTVIKLYWLRNHDFTVFGSSSTLCKRPFGSERGWRQHFVSCPVKRRLNDDLRNYQPGVDIGGLRDRIEGLEASFWEDQTALDLKDIQGLERDVASWFSSQGLPVPAAIRAEINNLVP